jgi:penicillin-binding protein 1A
MRAALRTSSNRAAVRMLQQVGIPETVQHAQRLGVGSLPSVPSLALGSGEVTLATMTAAYAAFANKGMLALPTMIRRVESLDGELLFQAAARPQRAVSEATAFLMTTMLADVINAGTAWQARRVGFTLPAAGKTGTTNDYHDAWFVGYTPSLVAGVWLGYDQPRTIMSGGYAGDLAVPIWGRFMKAATNGHEPGWFRAPATVTSENICRISGKLPGDGCRDVVHVDDNGELQRRSMVYTEYFVRGSEPSDYCPVHIGAFNAIVGTGGAIAGAPEAPQSSTPLVTGAALPPPPPPPAPAAVEPATAPEKKRGFWSRIFGIGKRDEKKDDKKKPPQI